MDVMKSEGKRPVYANADLVISGQAILVGKQLYIALGNYVAAEEGVYFREGVFEVIVKGTDVVSQGDLLYWDNTAKQLTSTSTANTLVGWAYKGSANGELLTQIKL